MRECSTSNIRLIDTAATVFLESGLPREAYGHSTEPEHQAPAVAESLDRRDLCIRLITVFGMVGAALALLLAVQPG
jgi:hypothetical protein